MLLYLRPFYPKEFLGQCHHFVVLKGRRFVFPYNRERNWVTERRKKKMPQISSVVKEEPRILSDLKLGFLLKLNFTFFLFEAFCSMPFWVCSFSTTAPSKRKKIHTSHNKWSEMFLSQRSPNLMHKNVHFAWCLQWHK